MTCGSRSGYNRYTVFYNPIRRRFRLNQPSNSQRSLSTPTNTRKKNILHMVLNVVCCSFDCHVTRMNNKDQSWERGRLDETHCCRKHFLADRENGENKKWKVLCDFSFELSAVCYTTELSQSFSPSSSSSPLLLLLLLRPHIMHLYGPCRKTRWIFQDEISTGI